MKAQAGGPICDNAFLRVRQCGCLERTVVGTFCREKQLPMMAQAWGDRRSQATASRARWLSALSFFRCHSTVLYTSMPCSDARFKIKFRCRIRICNLHAGVVQVSSH